MRTIHPIDYPCYKVQSVIGTQSSTSEMIPNSQLTNGKANKEVDRAPESPYILELPGKAAQNPCAPRTPCFKQTFKGFVNHSQTSTFQVLKKTPRAIQSTLPSDVLQYINTRTQSKATSTDSLDNTTIHYQL